MTTDADPHPRADRAVVLVSGGLDSAVTLAIAQRDCRECSALSFDYGQRHRGELHAAAAVARSLGAERHVVVPIGLRAIGGSALTADIEVPKDREPGAPGVPVTYVPARNLIFLSIAAGLAEVEGASAIYLGVNAVDYSGYPDCRPAFLEAFARVAAVATRAGDDGAPLTVRAPLLNMSKADIIRAAADLGVDLALTRSCYDPDGAGRACGRCDSCILRRRGFIEAGVPDPTIYRI